MVRQSSGFMPETKAATSARSISRGCGSGSARAVTITSCSAFATITRSTGSSSSAVRRRVVTRSRDLDDPRQRALGTRRVAHDPHPVADDHALAAQRPRLHRHHGDAVDQQREPAAVDRDDHAVDGVVVRRALLGARAGMPARALVVLLVLVGVAPGRPAHSRPVQNVREVREGLRRGRDVLDLDPVHGGARRSRRRAPSGGRRRCGTPRRAAGTGGTTARRRARSRRRRGRRARSPGRPAGRSRGRGCGRCRAGARASPASAHSAATAGASSPTSCRSRSTPSIESAPRTRSPSATKSTAQPIRGQDLAQRVAGLGRRARPVAHDHLAAAHRGQREERRGVRQVRLDGAVERADRAGRDRPPVGVGVVDLDAVLAQHRHRHLDVGERRDRLAVVAYVDAVLVAGPGQQQRGDELRRRRGVDDHRAARGPSPSRDPERQRPAAVVGRPAPRACAAP